jgi:zinc protease
VEEIAARNAIADAAATAENAFLAPGTPIARGTVAGTVREVRRASASALRRFYERFYTPDRATLIVVGDFDPELAEREIAARFDGWAGKAPPHASAQLATLSPRQTTEARLFVNPAAPTAVVVAAALPVGGDADVGRRRDAHFLERLGSDLLARRLRVLSPGAEAAVYDHFGTVRVARIELAAPDRDWRRTLKIASVELSSALETGFRQEELDAVLGTMRSSLVRDAAPRSTAALADGLADAVGRKIVFTAPADPAGTDLYLSRVRLATVNAAFRAAWAPSRLIFITHNRMVPDGERTILAAWEESLQPRTEKAPPSVQQPK